MAIGRVTKNRWAASSRIVCSINLAAWCFCVLVLVYPNALSSTRLSIFSGRWIEADKMTNNRDKHGLYVVTHSALAIVGNAKSEMREPRIVCV